MVKKIETVLKRVEITYIEEIDHDDVDKPRQIKVVTEITKWFPHSALTHKNPVKSYTSEYI